MSVRPALHIHAVGERTGAGHYRALCQSGMVTGPFILLPHSLDPQEVTCGHCLNRLEAQLEKAEIMDSLFDSPPIPPSMSDHFDGPEYDADRDAVRLTGQIEVIWRFMNDGLWRDVDYIARMTGFPANSVQAQLRNLRKPRYGAYLVERRRVTESGLYQYRVGEKGAGKPATVSCLNCARLERIIVEMTKEKK